MNEKGKRKGKAKLKAISKKTSKPKSLKKNKVSLLSGIPKADLNEVFRELSQDFNYKIVADEYDADADTENVPAEEIPDEELKFSALNYDPSTIRVAFRQYPIDLLLKRISEGAINFSPAFQRAPDIWDLRAKSRLIESLLIKIPLPVFYLDTSNEDRWDVIDGIQRLTTFKEFAVDKKLKLKGLEFMPELHGKGYDDLPRNLQRRFVESSISLYLIEKGTPNRVKQSIYERINTGGSVLVPQEIRHAIFQGSATKLLEEMAALDSFKKATHDGIDSLRMADKEYALRFAAFYLNEYKSYRTRDMNKFLSDTMERLSSASKDELRLVKEKFESSMKVSFDLFGNSAFRKPGAKSQINRALFEVWSSSLAKLSDQQIVNVLANKKSIRSRYMKLLKTPEFLLSVSAGSADVKKVHKRFESIEDLLKGIER